MLSPARPASISAMAALRPLAWVPSRVSFLLAFWVWCRGRWYLGSRYHSLDELVVCRWRRGASPLSSPDRDGRLRRLHLLLLLRFRWGPYLPWPPAPSPSATICCWACSSMCSGMFCAPPGCGCWSYPGSPWSIWEWAWPYMVERRCRYRRWRWASVASHRIHWRWNWRGLSWRGPYRSHWPIAWTIWGPSSFYCLALLFIK